MRGHPAIEQAAVALLCGWGDPVAYLAHADLDRTVADAVLERAAALRSEELAAVAKAIGAETGNRVAELLARVMPR